MSLAQRLSARAAAGLVALAALSSCATPASARTSDAPPPPVAVANIQLIGRAATSHAAWDPTLDTYRRGYVYPPGHSLSLNACGSTIDGLPARGASVVAGVRWRLVPLAGQRDAPIDVPPSSIGSCATIGALPALGLWRIVLTVRDAEGRESTDARTQTYRDVLVAAIGDSFASGEGNKLGHWDDAQCHRSHSAWPALVASALENRTTAVTFISFACSGADIVNLVDTQYRGMDWGGQRMLAPQARALRALLGDPLDAATRPVDVLLGAAGIGALDVADTLADCSVRHPLTYCQRDLSQAIATLPDLYGRLDVALSQNVRLGQAYFIGYPARIFTDAADHHTGCGVFRMTDGSAAWITSQARAVNQQLLQAAAAHGWRLMPTEDAFRHHGYCAGDASWFRSWTSSQHDQGNEDGTAHPNLQGQRAAAAIALGLVRTDVPAPAPARFVVRFLRLRVVDTRAHRTPWQALLRVGWFRDACARNVETVTSVSNGSWVDLSANPCLRYTVRTVARTIDLAASTSLFVPFHPPEDPQGHPRAPRPRQYSIDATLARANGWSATPPFGPTHVVRHVVTQHDGATFEIEYDVTVEPTLVPPA
jgi:hypothetical protein